MTGTAKNRGDERVLTDGAPADSAATPLSQALSSENGRSGSADGASDAKEASGASTGYDRKKVGSAAETIRTVTLGLLVVTLVALVIVYIGGTHIYQNMTSDAGKRPFNIEKLWSVRSDAGTDGLDKAHLLPEFIGYRIAGGSPVGSLADRESAEELYSLVGSCLSELFGSGSRCAGIDPDEGERLMNEALSGSEYIFIRYHEPVLARMIYAYAAGKLVISDSDVAYVEDGVGAVYISELVIKPDEDVAAHRFVAYASDGDGGYFRFSQDKSVVASDFYISKLADSGLKISLDGFSFSDSAYLRPRQPILDADLISENIASEPADVSDSKKIDGLLRVFGYNPDKASSYPDEYAMNYVDSGSRLRLGTGTIWYQANDAASGLRLDTLLGYMAGDYLSVYDKLTAVDNLIKRIGGLSDEFVGGEAVLCLGDVYMNEGRLVFEFFYTYDNIRIGGAPSLRAEIEQDRLYSFSLTAESYSGTDEESFNPPQPFILRKLESSGKLDGITDGEMRYVYRDKIAEWGVATRSHAAEARLFARLPIS